MDKILLPLVLILVMSSVSFSQNVSINEDGSSAHGSAILEVKSTDKGILIPRMTSAQRTAIQSPAQGLFVYDLTENDFYYFNGTSWVKAIGPQGAQGLQGPIGPQGPTGLLTSGSSAGNTPYWNGSAWVVNNSNIFNNGGNVGVGTTAPASKFHSSGAMRVGIPQGGLGGASATNGSIGFYNANNANLVNLQSGNTTSTYTMTLPTSQGAANTLLTNDGSGNLSWATNNSVRTFTIPNTGGAAQWVRLGTLTIGQDGRSATIRIVSNNGYNATETQNFEVNIRFKTSNGGSVNANGFAGDATYFYVGRNATFNETNRIKIVSNNPGTAATQYDFYVQFGTFTGSGSFYEVNTTMGVWQHAGQLTTDPGAASASVLLPSKEYSLGSNTIFANASNDVGIGTNNPASRLHVGGNVRVDALSGLGTRMVIVDNNGEMSTQPLAGVGLNSNWMVLGQDIYRLDGNVGIGLSNPTARLAVNGAIRGFDDLNIVRTDANAAIFRLHNTVRGYNFITNGAGHFELFDAAASATRIFVGSAGNVGIGTTAPNERLTVNGNLRTFGNIHVIKSDNSQAILRLYNSVGGFDVYTGTAGNFQVRDAQAGEVRMTILGNGNVGIGTTTPTQRLTVDGNFSVSGISNTAGDILGSGNLSIIRTTNTASLLQMGNSTHGYNFFMNTDGTLQIRYSVGNVSRIHIAQNGNIGIGTTAPSTAFHTVGGVRLQGLAGAGTRIVVTDENGVLSTQPIGSSGSNWTSSGLNITRMDGNVGVGTTSPSQKFHTVGGVRHEVLSGSGTRLVVTDANGVLSTLPLSSGGSNWEVNGSNIHRLNGNVGIGTSTPGSKLTVSGDFRASSDINLIRSDANNAIYRIQNTARSYSLITDTDGHFRLFDATASDTRIFVGSGGNVGIGTSAPGSKLTVNGDFRASSDINLIRSDANNAIYRIQNTARSYNLITDNSGHFRLFDATASETRLFVGSGGNVGIGVTNPGSRLVVNTNLAVRRDDNTNAWISILNSVKEYRMFVNSGGHFQILDFDQNQTRFFIGTGGNVGIGTTAPNKRLTVDYAGLSNNHAPVEFRGAGNHSWGINLVLRTTGNGDGAGLLFRNRDAKNWQIRGETGGNGFQITEDGGDGEYGSGFGTPRIHIAQGGFVGIGNNNPYFPLIMGSGAHVTTAGVWVNASDRRLKENIKPLNYGLAEVMRLKSVRYDMVNSKEKQIGFIAQDVQEVIPEVVSGKEGNLEEGETLGVAYGNLIPVLTNAIQEQQRMIEEQQKMIENLKADLEELKKRLIE